MELALAVVVEWALLRRKRSEDAFALGGRSLTMDGTLTVVYASAETRCENTRTRQSYTPEYFFPLSAGNAGYPCR